MHEPAPRSFREQGLKWLSVVAMALLTAYAAHPLLTLLLQVAEELGQPLGRAFMPLMLGAMATVLVVAGVMLVRRANALLRVEAGCRWSGILMLLTIPVMVLIVWLEASSASGGDQGGATAAFFMLLIFGGYYAIFGGGLLLVAAILRRRRLDAPRARPV